MGDSPDYALCQTIVQSGQNHCIVLMWWVYRGIGVPALSVWDVSALTFYQSVSFASLNLCAWC